MMQVGLLRAEIPIKGPRLILRGRTKIECVERGLTHAELSIGHDGEYCMACVIVGSDEPIRT